MARRNKIEFRVSVKDDASANLQRVSKEVDGLSSSLKGLAAGAFSLATIISVGRLADTYRLLQNRLRLVTKGTDELRAVTDELVKVSIRSRTSFQSTADLYARVARSSRTLGLSQQELLDFTETVSKSIRISGSTAQEAAAGVIQFGQALASSRLSGDELRSVLEQMPRLAQAIAEGMGVNIGTLRELGEAGDLTAVKVLDALRKAAPEIADEFSQLTPLVSEALGNLDTAISITIGTLDEAAGASAAFADAIIDLANELVLFGPALTGNLSAKQLREISDESKVLVIALSGIAFAIGSIKDVLALSPAGTALDLAQNLVSRLAEAGFDPNGEGDILKALRLAVDDTLDDVSHVVENTVLNMTNRMEAFAAVFNNVINGIAAVREEVDLTISDPADDDVTRKQRDAIRKAENQLENLIKKLKQSNQAFAFARDIGLEYADALKIIEINALGASSGNRELELSALRLLEINKDLAASAEEREAAEKAAAKELADAMKFAENIARRAAENIQDAFAEFLFDPFEKGVKGMLLGFINALREMLAQALAFQILSNIPGIGAFFAKNVTRAAGGPVSAGQPVLVGERGPELFIPNASGNIRNNATLKAGGNGGMQFVTNIDARGADPGLIARLPQIMEQRDRQLMLMVKDLIENGGVLI